MPRAWGTCCAAARRAGATGQKAAGSSQQLVDGRFQFRRVVGFFHGHVQERKVGAGKCRVDELVALPAVFPFMRRIVELDAGERGEVTGAHEQEVDVLAGDPIARRLAFVALESAFDPDDIFQPDLPENANVRRQHRLQHREEGTLRRREEGFFGIINAGVPPAAQKYGPEDRQDDEQGERGDDQHLWRQHNADDESGGAHSHG